MINKQRIMDLFFEYVQIDSETGSEKNMADRLVQDLEAMGLRVYKGEIGDKVDSDGYNVYAYLDGDKNHEPVLLSSHMDTVVPGKGIEPYIEDGYVRSRGNTILGGDDKSGIVAVIEAIKTAKEQGISTRPVEILFTIREESGMGGSKNVEYDKLSAKWGFVFDSSGDVGRIITLAPGQLKINAKITGKTAHAGVSPEDGISAISVAAEAVANMKLLRIDEETTANIGTFKGVSPTNVVCQTVEIIAEARSRNYDKLVAQGEHMKKCFEDACAKFGATCDVNIDTSYISFSVDENDELIKFVGEKMNDMGITPSLASSGGGSDANMYNRNGIKSVVLGTGMDKVHTTNEQITVANIENLGELVYRIIKV